MRPRPSPAARTALEFEVLHDVQEFVVHRWLFGELCFDLFRYPIASFTLGLWKCAPGPSEKGLAVRTPHAFEPLLHRVSKGASLSSSQFASPMARPRAARAPCGSERVQTPVLRRFFYKIFSGDNFRHAVAARVGGLLASGRPLACAARPLTRVFQGF